MACVRNIVTVLTLLVLLVVASCQNSQGGPHQSQGGPHQSQGRERRQAPQNGPSNGEITENPIAASCNGTSISCFDCTTRVICKPNSLILLKCRGPVKPYCNAGLCSSVLSSECE